MGKTSNITENALREIIIASKIPLSEMERNPKDNTVSPGIVNGRTINTAKIKSATHLNRFRINSNGILERITRIIVLTKAINKTLTSLSNTMEKIRKRKHNTFARGSKL